MHYRYRTEMVCSQEIEFDINDDVVTNIKFYGGCNGNLKAIAKLLEGKKADYIIEKLEGNTCGYRPTSCADQLTKAIKKARKEINTNL